MNADARHIPDGLETPAALTAEDVEALCRGLRARARPARSMDEAMAAVAPLARVAARWLDEADPIRREALAALPAASPFDAAMWRDALGAIFAPITADALRTFVAEELAGCESLAFQPLVGQVLAGNVPAPAVQSIFVGLMAGSAQLVKTAGEDRLFPVLLARSIASAAPELADRLAVVHWAGESRDCNLALAENADAVIAFGGAEAIRAWRELRGALAKGSRLNESGRGLCLIGHGPRTSLEIVAPPDEAAACRALAAAVAFDAALYDQQGCLSPQQVYVVGGAERAQAFAALLGEALAERARVWPIGRRDLGHRLAIRRARESVRIRMLAGGEGSEGSEGSPWLLAGPEDRFDYLLIGAAGASPQIGPGGRTLFLSRVASVEQAVEAIAPAAEFIQGVALGNGAERQAWARRLAEELHIPYVCRPGRLQCPPFGWRNDNVRPLRSLLI